MKAIAGLIGMLVVPLSGCKASVHADAKVGDDDEVEDFDKPLDESLQAQMAEPASPEGFALLGARQDLAYRGPATAKCQCLSVALGQGRDKSFEWATAVPETDPQNQLVVAISSEPCPAAGDVAPGASYWGFKADGANVIVVVENAVEGRPVASGAIIPKPLGDGQVYIEPLNKAVAYGRSADGRTARCAIGNPGPARPAAAAAKSAPAESVDSAGFKRIGGQSTKDTPETLD